MKEPLVEDLMTSDVFTLLVDHNMRAFEELMTWRAVRHVPVVDDDNKLVGLVTHRDFLKLAVSKLAELDKHKENRMYEHINIEEIMEREVETVSPDTSLKVAAQKLTDHKYGCLPVVHEDKLVGIITESDFARAFHEWNIQILN